MDDNLRKTIMIEHYNNPINKKLIDDSSYYKVNINSESCIDNLDFMVKIEDDIIKDSMFDGEACVISTSASSIMNDLIIGKTVDEVLNIIDNYEAMIDEKKYNEECLGEANAFNQIYKQANRKKCALLPFDGLKKIIYKYKGDKLNEK